MIKKHTAEPITDEDIPYDIPDSWEWVRFADLVTFYQGKLRNVKILLIGIIANILGYQSLICKTVALHHQLKNQSVNKR